MKMKFTKIQKTFCIFFIGMLCTFSSILIVLGAEEYSPDTSVYSRGSRTEVNGTYVTSTYGLYLDDYSSKLNEAYYSVGSYYSFEGRAQLLSDNLYINDVFVGTFSSNNGWHDAGTIQRDEVFDATLKSGRNIIETKNVGGVGGNSRQSVTIRKFASPPEVTGTDGTWMEGEVASGKRTWQSIYTDGATGSVEGNKVQTSTGFMYSDIDEKENINDPTIPVNAYNTEAVIGRNSYIKEVMNANTGEKLSKYNVNALNNAGKYLVTSCTSDSGGLEGCGTRYITVKYNNPPVITGTDKTFYENEITPDYWYNTLRTHEMSAIDAEDGNITSKVSITYDDVNVSVPGVYKVVYSVSDSHGKSTSKEIKVTVKFNNPPVITGTDKIFYEGQYTPTYWKDTLRLKDMNASDVEDGNITSKVNIPYDNVDVNVPGVYKVVYQVTDRFGKSTSKEIKVTVKYNNPPVLSAEDRWFYVEDDVNQTKIMERVKANDIEDGDISNQAVIHTSNVQSGVIGVYNVSYKVTDAFGKSAVISATIHIVSNTPSEDAEVQYLRFISEKHLPTLKEKSIWKSEGYNTLLMNSIGKTQDSEAVEVWHITQADIEAMKDFHKDNTFSKESAQAFYEQFKYVIKESL